MKHPIYYPAFLLFELIYVGLNILFPVILRLICDRRNRLGRVHICKEPLLPLIILQGSINAIYALHFRCIIPFCIGIFPYFAIVAFFAESHLPEYRLLNGTPYKQADFESRLLKTKEYFDFMQSQTSFSPSYSSGYLSTQWERAEKPHDDTCNDWITRTRRKVDNITELSYYKYLFSLLLIAVVLLTPHIVLVKVAFPDRLDTVVVNKTELVAHKKYCFYSFFMPADDRAEITAKRVLLTDKYTFCDNCFPDGDPYELEKHTEPIHTTTNPSPTTKPIPLRFYGQWHTKDGKECLLLIIDGNFATLTYHENPSEAINCYSLKYVDDRNLESTLFSRTTFYWQDNSILMTAYKDSGEVDYQLEFFPSSGNSSNSSCYSDFSNRVGG